MCMWINTRSKNDKFKDTEYQHPEDIQNTQSPGSQFGTRHCQCFMAFLALSSAYTQRINLSVVIAAMTGKSSSKSEFLVVLPWDESMRGTVMSAFFWGYLLLKIPAGQLAEKYGSKYILIATMFASGVITILTPFAAIYGGFYWMVFARFLLGAIHGCLIPPTNFLLANWIPTSERGKLITFVYNGSRFGTVLIMTTGGFLAHSKWGWPLAFYAPGAMAVLWAIAYFYVGASYPQDHRTISVSEKECILSSLPNSSDRKGLVTPWKAILTSKPMWAVLISHVCYDCIYWTLLTQIPYFINVCYGLDLKKSGYLSAIPYALSMGMSVVYVETDKMLMNNNLLSRTACKKWWNSVTLWGPALALSLLVFLGESLTWTLVLIVCAVCLGNAIFLGFFSNHIDLSPNFSGTLMAITSTVSSLSSIASPLYVGYVVTDPKSLFQWHIVFLTIAALLFVGNLVYIILGTTDVQPWNFPPEKLVITSSKLQEEQNDNDIVTSATL